MKWAENQESYYLITISGAFSAYKGWELPQWIEYSTVEKKSMPRLLLEAHKVVKTFEVITSNDKKTEECNQ